MRRKDKGDVRGGGGTCWSSAALPWSTSRFQNEIVDIEPFVAKALLLAKRGLNVDAMFFLWGSGGVGLSLLTAHLAATHGPDLHKYVDPNIFFLDELRKMLELLVGGILYTGHERPMGSKSDVREDLLKKFCSADGLAGRLPYGVLTKMFKITGWKKDRTQSHVQLPERVRGEFRIPVAAGPHH